MTVHKGTTRLVLVFLGIAIKFPRIQFKVVISDIIKHVLDNEYGTLRCYLKRPTQLRYPPGLRFYLFAGISSNWNEYIFWVKNKNSFCEPTYFSLFGLFNVQRASPPFLRLTEKEFRLKMVQVEGYDRHDSHHFFEKKNFNNRGGVIYIVDYSNKETQEVILKSGGNIRNKFSS